METFFFFLAIFVIYKILTSTGSGKKSSKNNESNGARGTGLSDGVLPAPQRSPAPAPVPQRPPVKDTYRPTPSRASGGIVFKSSENQNKSSPSVVSQEDLKGLCDAFTGEKLDIANGIYRCEKCKVHYHTESYEVLRVENNSACVACGSNNLLNLAGSSARTTTGRNYDPSVVTLENIRSQIGRVVTFEGHVHSVKVSRRGTDYAVMFEQKSWVNGFKLVFFGGAAQRVGGAQFIQGLNGRTLRVRGLVIDHARFGLEIIVSERSMIVSIR